MSVLSGKVGDYCMYERASRCPVCLQRFSLPPPQLPLISRAAKAASVAFTALCVGLLACGMISPPWPHVLLVVVLLVGVRLQAAFAVVVLLLLLLLLLALSSHGLRLVLTVDGGQRLGLALIRHGAPVEGLRAGILLVAARDLRAPMFRETVILITQHSARGGTRGVILTHALARPPPHDMADARRNGQAAERPGRQQVLEGSSSRHRHFLGGPVGLPQELGGSYREPTVLLLHRLPGVPGAVKVPLQQQQQAAATSGANGAESHLSNNTSSTSSTSSSVCGAGSSDEERDDGWVYVGLQHGGHQSDEASTAPAPAPAPARAWYYGGSLAGIEAAATSVPRQQGHGPKAGPSGATLLPREYVYVFHGVCAWSSGQLEGEVRSGSWALVEGLGEEELHAVMQATGGLWRAMLVSGRLRWA